MRIFGSMVSRTVNRNKNYLPGHLLIIVLFLLLAKSSVTAQQAAFSSTTARSNATNTSKTVATVLQASPPLWQAIVSLLLIVGMFVVLATEAFDADCVMLGTLVIFMCLGFLPVSNAMVGFSNSGMLTVLSLMAASAGLESSGALSYLRYAMEIGGSKYMSVHFVLLRVCIIGGAVSAFLNNTPVVAFFIPIMKELSVKYGFSVAEVMIPVSYAAILGGTCTLIGTSTNLVAIDLATKNIKGFKMGLFDMGRIGLPVLLAGSLYIIVFAPIFFRGRRVKSAALDAPKRYVIAMRIGEACHLIGRALSSAKLLLSDDRVELVSAHSAGGVIHLPSEGATLKAGDVLHVETTLASIREVPGLPSAGFC
jgi:di/tricarboxylate transporter